MTEICFAPPFGLRSALDRFRRDEAGSVAIESAFYLPLLLAMFAAIFTLYDAFRQESISIKAAYTISDLVSRETATLDDVYMDNMYLLTQAMTRDTRDVSMRISAVYWDEANKSYGVDWSVERGAGLEVWNNDTINTVAENLPVLPDQERVILVETWNNLLPVFNVGLDNFNLYNFVFTRPRFAGQVIFEGMRTSDGPVHDDGTEDATP
ncbi:MAG: pilus assembly protein [Epibacterium sp.]|nr:pilus assembly protein [Epibacterium sp.]NQX73254.1 pilus assembly protein [Epibacterium sp.]